LGGSLKNPIMRRAGGPRAAVALAVSAIIFVACTQSRVDPGADILIDGTVAREDGRPARDARVALTKEPDFFDVLFTVTSLGLACLADEVPDACDDARVIDAGSDGRFSLDVKGRDTQGLGGNAATMGLSAVIRPSEGMSRGPGTTVRFQVQTTSLDLALRLWEPVLQFEARPRRARLAFSDLPAGVLPAQASPADARVEAHFRSAGGRLVWRLPRIDRVQEFDARVLEDTRGDISVVAYVDDVEVDVSEGVELDVALTSGRLPYESPAGRPDSRGRPCSLVTQDRVTPVTPCPLSDGDFEEAELAEAACPEGEAECLPVRSAFVDLQRPVDVLAVVVRGCTQRCVVEASGDGETYRQLGVGTPPAGATNGPGYDDVILALSEPSRARFVRVVTDGPAQGLREISVFDPTVEAALPPPEVEEDRRGELGRLIEREGDEPSSPLVWIAVALAALAIALIFFWRLRLRGKQTEPSAE
jgi:hypothetical protein